MATIKNLLIFAAATILTVALIASCGQMIGVRNPGFAFIVNWMVMTWVAIFGAATGLPIPVPNSYYRIRQFESDGQLYELLGVRAFRTLLMRSPFGLLNSTIQYAGSRSSLDVLDANMRGSEDAHLLIFLIVTVLCGCAAAIGWWDLSAWLMVFNIPINVYPMMLQRYNRARLAPILRRARFKHSPDDNA